jgi:hypothetical protein
VVLKRDLTGLMKSGNLQWRNYGSDLFYHNMDRKCPVAHPVRFKTKAIPEKFQGKFK